MASEGTTLAPTWSTELNTFLKQLQREALILVLAGFGLAALIILGLEPYSPNPGRAFITGAVLLASTAALWAVQRRSYAPAAAAAVVLSLLAVLVVIHWLAIAAVVGLLAVPAGLVTLLFDVRLGTLMATAGSAYLGLMPPNLLAASPAERAVAALMAWATVAMLWLTLRPLLNAVQWAWSGYERSVSLLERARDMQVRLQRTLEDLTSANVQLTRMNRLVDGLRQAAEAARKAKEEFVASVSHELRTPLNMIIGFSEMMLDAPETYAQRLPGTLLADLAVILRNSRHLAGLIDDVLDLSQIEGGQMALTREQAPLHEIVEEAATAVRPLYETKSLFLETEVPADLPLVYCDCTRVREVLLNLLSNAGRFTEQGGVRVRAWSEGPDVVVSIVDTGPGIAEEDQQRLFTPFQQLDGSIRRRYGGSGLGLSISRKLVELHGGRMWVESAVGAGTTFFFALPIESPPAAQLGPMRWLSQEWQYVERTERPLAPPPPVRPHFVVVEAGQVLQRLLSRHLTDAEVVPARDLAEAVELATRTPCHGLLVNTDLPGAALAQLVAQTGLPYGTPAIACSVPSAPEAAQALGAVDYLVKPVSREALMGAVGRLRPAGSTVLVVDDDPEVLQLYWRMLSMGEARYRVLTAGDGQSALAMMRQQPPDMLVADLMMPGMDGFQLLAAKNEDPTLRSIPTIVVSARDPTGQPIVSSGLAVTRAGGLSVWQLLNCIRAVSTLLAPMGWPGGSGRPGDRAA